MSLLFPLRIVLFYFLLAFTAFVWCLVSLVFAPFMAFRARYRFVVQNWCRCAIWLGKTLVGLRYEVHGAENVPARPCVILAKHQSTWETFFLSAYFEPLTQVLKRELLRVPFFGWAIMLLKPIAIDRDNPKAALRQVAKQGHERLEQGAWVLIFPEGTRVPVGQPAKFSRSGAALAVNAGLPVLPIAHNAGMFWPKAGWGKRPGTIQVVIGPPMMAESEGPRAVAELNQRAEDWVNAQVSQLEVEGRPTH
ncbi:lysophospholipid acyltransferase family protein [Stutzerimonas stutzeri]|uniref:lysophospholipid acyltransferase family protein n=1 Tax=Stutzerimonas stutzeri TaxID=316 RepID=UPI0007758550|nr:lysophospholipid acyltransferase family protein [Stutzerimonas stutzeri]MBA4690483.1 1-acyl-sn-glycerol-3-phosphate acyltransferase [Pseudomonas sp.]KXO73097.1 glycerol acyltransferase [Stutzerimonas stutzeri]MBD9412372.1 1-acyl-sn-glycerol-3-phosphate acyltransferase [Stutzerimonas stutzeri]MBW8335467.1 1-acyl-sn-glycerol-3-phosphate acyltransferase [Pseudomonas sp.]MCP3430676.1 1-acyl-sn-glycerol-3-phosphate acyltransferase [Stutzerimonas stutzeri]